MADQSESRRLSSRKSGRTYAEAEFLAHVPQNAVSLKCRGWGISANRASDIADDASDEALQRSLARDFVDAAHYRAWVTKTAIHFAGRLLRQRAHFISLTSAHEPPCDTRESEIGEITESISRAREALSPQQREILRLTFDEGLTLDEIAASVLPDDNGSLNARRLRIERRRKAAIATLRSILHRNGFCEDGD